MPDYYSTREVGRLLKQPIWRVQRLFEDGDLPEPQRFAGKRAIAAATLPSLIEAMRARGWITLDGQELASA